MLKAKFGAVVDWYCIDRREPTMRLRLDLLVLPVHAAAIEELFKTGNLVNVIVSTPETTSEIVERLRAADEEGV